MFSFIPSVRFQTMDEMEGAFVYVTSNGSPNIYPLNSNHAFENLITPLHLNKHLDYEVGCMNVFLPTTRYAILAEEDDFGMTIEYERENKWYKFFKYIPIRSLTTTETHTTIVEKINRDFERQLNAHINEGFDIPVEITPAYDLLNYDKKRRSVFVFCNPESDQSTFIKLIQKGDMSKVAVTFNEGIASILGFDAYKRYRLKDDTIGSFKIFGPNPLNSEGGSSHIYFYTDLVKETRFGSENVSILDIMTLSGGTQKNYNSVLYKSLKPTNEITSVAISMYDQRGIKVKYAENGNILVILHIRPVRKD